MIRRLLQEPPIRLLTRAALRSYGASVSTRARWGISKRPAYLLGMEAAARQAKRQGERAISVIEFGVANGEGLLAMQNEAVAIERETGIMINVYGFDNGSLGLPNFTGDHRDHPDIWRPGDYPMDVEALRAKLFGTTKLIIGNIADTVPQFFRMHQPPPIGFIAVDVDLYSSTRNALAIFGSTYLSMLWHVPMYFDDVDLFFSHKAAGELLAIDEFNARQESVYIDRWHGVANGVPFPESSYYNKMYIAHDELAIARMKRDRIVNVL